MNFPTNYTKALDDREKEIGGWNCRNGIHWSVEAGAKSVQVNANLTSMIDSHFERLAARLNLTGDRKKDFLRFNKVRSKTLTFALCNSQMTSSQFSRIKTQLSG